VGADSDGTVAVPAAIAAVLTYCLLGNILDGLIVAVPFWIIVGSVSVSLPCKRCTRHSAIAGDARRYGLWRPAETEARFSTLAAAVQSKVLRCSSGRQCSSRSSRWSKAAAGISRTDSRRAR